MNCQEFKKIIDSYLSDELLVETNHDVLRHLESCSWCRSDVATRKGFRARVNDAVRNTPEFRVDPSFSLRLAADLKNTALRSTFYERIVGFGGSINLRTLTVGFASILLAVSGILLYVRDQPDAEKGAAREDVRPIAHDTAAPDNVTDQSIQASWSELEHKAVGDHKNCAIDFHLSEKPISLDTAAKKYGAFNKDLETVVISALRSSNQKSGLTDVELLAAHSCIFAGRHFSHIVLREKGTVISILVADSELPSGTNMINTNLVDGGFSVAGFQAGHHSVFVVSELPGSDNAAIAEAISRRVRDHISNLEA